MDLIADILLVSGALGAGLYCFILSRRLSRFNDLKDGMGGAVAVLSGQVDDLTTAMEQAKAAAKVETEKLEALTDRAQETAKQLELMMASMHDLPTEQTRREPETNAQPIFSRAARRAS